MITSTTNEPLPASLAEPPRFDGHVVLLTNFVAPHKRPMYVELARRVKKLTVLISTPMEANRKWEADWQDLDVRLLRTSTLRTRWKHPAGFVDPAYIHVPWNTVGVLRRLKPDAIIAGELGVRSLLATVYARLVRLTPLVLFAGLSQHTECGRGGLRTWLRRRLLRRADWVLVNGQSGAEYVASFGFDRARISRVHYPTLPGRFDDLPLERDDADAHNLLFVGQLIERKGVLPFTRALAAWAEDHPERPVHFRLVGSGPLREAMEAVPRPANFELELLGQCDYAQVAEAYRRGGIFAFPSLADDWGMAVNEAMTAGLPVLGSIYSQAVEELCREGETGWPFRADRPDEMRRAIDAALSTPPRELARMREAARTCVSTLTPGQAASELLIGVRSAVERVNCNRTSETSTTNNA